MTPMVCRGPRKSCGPVTARIARRQGAHGWGSSSARELAGLDPLRDHLVAHAEPRRCLLALSDKASLEQILNHREPSHPPTDTKVVGESATTCCARAATARRIVEIGRSAVGQPIGRSL